MGESCINLRNRLVVVELRTARKGQILLTFKSLNLLNLVSGRKD